MLMADEARGDAKRVHEMAGMTTGPRIPGLEIQPLQCYTGIAQKPPLFCTRGTSYCAGP
jgi:hypothetical protein